MCRRYPASNLATNGTDSSSARIGPTVTFIERVQQNQHQVALKVLDANKLHADAASLVKSLPGAGRDKILVADQITRKYGIQGFMDEVFLRVTAFCSLHKQMLSWDNVSFYTLAKAKTLQGNGDMALENGSVRLAKTPKQQALAIGTRAGTVQRPYTPYTVTWRSCIRTWGRCAW